MVGRWPKWASRGSTCKLTEDWQAEDWRRARPLQLRGPRHLLFYACCYYACYAVCEELEVGVESRLCAA
jgi:hypothetical protein